MSRSLLELRIRVDMVAIVPHPKPRTIGRTAFPFSPISRMSRSDKIESLGRYPLSSRRPKAMKKVPTTGRTIPMA